MSRPLDLLEKSLEKKVIVKMKNNSEISGILKSYDIHLNLYLDQCTEQRNETMITLGEALIRGDTIILISPGV